MTTAAALEAALRARVGRTSDRALDVRGDVVFEATGVGTWTVRFRAGGPTLRDGRPWSPACTIRADPATLLAVIEGSAVGVDEFLNGRLSVRGNLALSLELDDLLPLPVRDPRAPRCRRVEVAGVRSFFLEAGPEDGTPVVLLHGLGATSASFLPTLWDLARDHRVIAVDLPGFGESGKPRVALRPDYYARWVVALLDVLELPRAHLVGNSMGGRIALEVALRSPDRVDRVALLAPSMAWLRFRAAAGLVRLLRPELAILPLPTLHALVVRVLRSMFVQPDRVPQPAMAAAADEFVRVFASAGGRVAFFSALRQIYLERPHGESGFWTRLPALARPALFVFGHHDWLVPRGFVRHVARALPTAPCVTLDDCGHVPQFEQPERTHALIRQLFEGRLPVVEAGPATGGGYPAPRVG